MDKIVLNKANQTTVGAEGNKEEVKGDKWEVRMIKATVPTLTEGND